MTVFMGGQHGIIYIDLTCFLGLTFETEYTTEQNLAQGPNSGIEELK